MPLSSEVLQKLFVLFTVYTICLSIPDNSLNISNTPKFDGDINSMKLSKDSSSKDDNKLESPSDKLLPIPIKIQDNKSENRENANGEANVLALEGGDALSVSPQAISGVNTEQPEQVKFNNTHTKGVVKGRKGAGQFPGSTIVARKGVEETHMNKNNSNLILNLPMKESTAGFNRPNLDNQTISNTNHLTNSEVLSSGAKKNYSENFSNQEITHSKKPEILSDIGDTNEFEDYIKPSTTGEDYVIIGIAVVIGIWFAVFGALIFYRRAGEYWDRRHYRRMDFLVEGMYND